MKAVSLGFATVSAAVVIHFVMLAGVYLAHQSYSTDKRHLCALIEEHVLGDKKKNNSSQNDDDSLNMVSELFTNRRWVSYQYVHA